MARLLIVPAAGLGSRLGASRPKALVPVAGVPMLTRLFSLYALVADQAVVVVRPAHLEAMNRHLADARQPWPVAAVVQPEPTGMLDAILLATPLVVTSAASSIWITWCDQVAVRPATIARLAQATGSADDAALTMPTASRPSPYVHFDRDAHGRIVGVRHRREGDAMPEDGESDMGLFALSRAAFLQRLQEYDAVAPVAPSTGERNFLPFIPWLASRDRVVTFPCEDPMEAVGINTPAELAAVEAYLAR